VRGRRRPVGARAVAPRHVARGPLGKIETGSDPALKFAAAKRREIKTGSEPDLILLGIGRAPGAPSLPGAPAGVRPPASAQALGGSFDG
jgi:hypothetical protein